MMLENRVVQAIRGDEMDAEPVKWRCVFESAFSNNCPTGIASKFKISPLTRTLGSTSSGQNPKWSVTTEEV